MNRAKGKELAALFASVVFIAGAIPANAYEGGCYKDPLGRCFFAPINQSPEASTLEADLDAFGDTPDQHFAYGMTHDDSVPEFRITDFDILKAHGLKACDLRISGMLFEDIDQFIEDLGPYPPDVASVIVSHAVVSYCPWAIEN